MATGARVAAAIACAGRSMGRRAEVWWWRGRRVQEELRYADEPSTERHQLGSKEAALSAGIPQQWAVRQQCGADGALCYCRLRAVLPVSDN